jgi:DNA-binding response OmpR family regulator
MAHVLVINESEMVREVIAALLERDGHIVLHATDGAMGVRRFWNDRPDLVIMDVRVPKLDGWGVLSRVRELSETPAIMTVPGATNSDRVRALQAGADDVIDVPFHGPELRARVSALLRRIGRTVPSEKPSMSDGWAAVDSLRHEASVSGKPLQLTPIEFRLLCAFLRHQNAALSHEQLLSLVWDGPFGSKDQVKVAVLGLRRKLAAAAREGDSAIQTVRGVGYRWETPAAVRAA